jgi:hypothetical protein
MTFRLALQGGACDGRVATLTSEGQREPPETIFVYRANPTLILAAPPGGDPDVVSESFVVYWRSGRWTRDGAGIYSHLS